jgi:hypothetical protein
VQHNLKTTVRQRNGNMPTHASLAAARHKSHSEGIHAITRKSRLESA